MGKHEFRVIVTGSRDLPSEEIVWSELAMLCAERLPEGGKITVVHGDCPTGADRYARTWCELPAEPGYDLEVVEERHPADWAHCTADCYHRPRTNPDGSNRCPAAGPRRNNEMVALGADLVVAFPYGKSIGTRHCMAAADRAGIPVEVVER